ncbi:MAG: hypothetical protein MUD14_11650 [Hydrococcus sp. Prado102]|jgi:dolichol kinase|nr:hypothetical protein [Hydrococcus sp. Prado102]
MLAGFWQLIFFNLVVKDDLIALQITFPYQILLIILSAIGYSSNRIIGLAGLMYGASSRIRDGIDGRKNLFVARLSVLNLFLLAYIEYLARKNAIAEANLMFFSVFIFLPLTIGDAMGEIIGTVWGKQKLRVWGIGQINRKSFLGTASVFLGSLLPLLLIVIVQALPFQWWWLCLVVSVTTTVIELLAPRGTDNFFIPIANGLVCLIFAVHFLPK